MFSPTASFSISSNRVESRRIPSNYDAQLVTPPFVQVHALAVDVLLVHGHSAPGDHVEPPRQRRALVFAERRALTQFQQFSADAVAEPPQLEFRRCEDVNVHVVDVPFVRVSIDVPGQVVFGDSL